MSAFISFTKKEFSESLRTYRLIILAAVFLLLGIISPLFARLMPALLSGMDMGGIVITLPEPTAMDSWAQFFSNVGQMGMLALIIFFSGIMANELSRGTLVNLLTKGMKRHTVILTKFLSAGVKWTLSYLLCLVMCYVYTVYFWPDSVLENAFLAFGSLWLFGMLLIAILIFGGTLFGNFFGSLLSCFGVIAILNLLGMVPAVGRFNPVSLAGNNFGLLDAQQSPDEFIPAVIICATATVLLIVASIAVFNKKRL